MTLQNPPVYGLDSILHQKWADTIIREYELVVDQEIDYYCVGRDPEDRWRPENRVVNDLLEGGFLLPADAQIIRRLVRIGVEEAILHRRKEVQGLEYDFECQYGLDPKEYYARQLYWDGGFGSSLAFMAPHLCQAEYVKALEPYQCDCDEMPTSPEPYRHSNEYWKRPVLPEGWIPLVPTVGRCFRQMDYNGLRPETLRILEIDGPLVIIDSDDPYYPQEQCWLALRDVEERLGWIPEIGDLAVLI